MAIPHSPHISKGKPRKERRQWRGIIRSWPSSLNSDAVVDYIREEVGHPILHIELSPIGFHNVECLGLDSAERQLEIRRHLRSTSPSIFELLETKIKFIFFGTVRDSSEEGCDL